jgi:hypothetical protein
VAATNAYAPLKGAIAWRLQDMLQAFLGVNGQLFAIIVLAIFEGRRRAMNDHLDRCC